jgi:hypothetical protein
VNRYPLGIGAVAGLLVIALLNGCHHKRRAVSANGGSPASMTGTGGTGGVPAGGAGGTGGGGLTSINLFDDAGQASDATDEAATNPCGSECGPVELCDTAHLGYDDNCNGLVDETCTCAPGQVHWCFAGDPSYRHAPGCFDGVETCTELGTWGPCVGGVQAIPPDNCYLNDTSSCHAITALPYGVTDLKTGTGNFSANAVPGSEVYAVQCPSGVSECPGVTPPESFQALQSGEYLVTYTKMVAGDPSPLACTFPLFVGALGIRFELSWEHPLTTSPNPSGADLDLHVHQPLNTDPWAVSPGAPQDCTWSSCKVDQISKGVPPAPHWFPDTDVVPMPVNWDLQGSLDGGVDGGDDAGTLADLNTCYNDPCGVGAQWAALGMGCHNPRQDIDEITCLPGVTDPNNPEFCAPENTNIDFPPQDQWIRVGVHYFYNHNVTYDVHPEIKVFCDGALVADLGPQGYYVAQPDGGPDAGVQAVVFPPSDGEGFGVGNIFWVVADVASTTDSCGRTVCVVQPIYADPTSMAPYLTLDATTSFMPPWPVQLGADAGPTDAGLADGGP